MQMKSEPREKFVLRVENSFKGNQFIKSLKKHLNKNTYDVRVRYSGKRPKGTNQVSTRKENATSMRVYITDHGQEHRVTDLRTMYWELFAAYSQLRNQIGTIAKNERINI